MAKRKQPLKPRPRSVPTEAEQASMQVTAIAVEIDTYTKHSIECWCCGERDSCRDVSEIDFAISLHERGWRHVTSNKFATTGVVCPKCANTPDADRSDYSGIDQQTVADRKQKRQRK